MLEFFWPFLHCKLFYKRKIYKFQQIIENVKEKMLNEGNQIHNFISSSGSGTVINNGSDSGSDFLSSYVSVSGTTSQKVTVPTVPVPVPQHCFIPVPDICIFFVIRFADDNFKENYVTTVGVDLKFRQGQSLSQCRIK
jgi:hypothetical protein